MRTTDAGIVQPVIVHGRCHAGEFLGVAKDAAGQAESPRLRKAGVRQPAGPEPGNSGRDAAVPVKQAGRAGPGSGPRVQDVVARGAVGPCKGPGDECLRRCHGPDE